MLVTRASFDEAVHPFLDVPRLIYDTETTGLHWWLGDRVCGVAIGLPSLQHVCYFPVRHAQGENIRPSQYRFLLRLLSRRFVIYTGWNMKFDVGMLMADGMTEPDYFEDVMLAAHHLNENDQPFKLKVWGRNYLGAEAARSEDELNAKLKALGYGKDDMYLLDPAEIEPYATDDVRLTERLRRLFIPALRRWDTLDLWQESNDYSRITARMERRGMQLDVPLVKTYNKEAKRNAREAYEILAQTAGYEINLNSPKQVQLFLGVSSSRKEVVEEMETPEANALLRYRCWFKAHSTYYSRWLEIVGDDGVLHPHLNLHGTVTGRQSASDPNMHAVPRYRPEYKVKDCVIARPGHVLLSSDYNQMELRLGTSIAREERMAKLFLTPTADGSPVDIHQSVADALGISRDSAKTINFMILYGGGVAKLAAKLKIPLEQAAEYLDAYHREYWHFRYVSKWLANQSKYCGYTRLWTGRVRHFNSRRANPKDTFNVRVQGGGAEMLRIAITNLAPQLAEYDAHMLLQIHDQIITEVPKAALTDVVALVTQEMEAFTQFLVPPRVDHKVGLRWGDLKDLKEWVA